MSITYLTKDITTAIYGVVAHGCNCQGAFGSGVAGAIKKKWPLVAERYFSYVSKVTELNDAGSMLGQVQTIRIDSPEDAPLYVANMFTQLTYGNDGKVYASPAAIECALTGVLAFCRGHDLPLLMPKVGCGLGGLSWDNDVEPILQKLHEEYYTVDVFICDI
jgi:O-acetyl-ADP-ribose deacetylase (regulator of RNase III)